MASAKRRAAKSSKNGGSSNKRQRMEDDEDSTSKARWFGSNVQVRKQFAFLPVFGKGRGEEEDEAIIYMRKVMSEAGSLGVITAKNQGDADAELNKAIYESGHGDSRGYYEDGAYIAAPLPGAPVLIASDDEQNGDSDWEADIDPREAYAHRLKTAFLSTRRVLHSRPPQSAVAALGDDHPVLCRARSSKAGLEWRRRLRSTYPIPAQVALMDRATLWRLLKISRDQLGPTRNLSKQLSCWIWALLGKLRDTGEMHASDVASLREFAKRAAEVKTRMLDRDAAAKGSFGNAEEEDDYSGSDGDDESDADSTSGEVDLEAAKARLLGLVYSAPMSAGASEDKEAQKTSSPGHAGREQLSSETTVESDKESKTKIVNGLKSENPEKEAGVSESNDSTVPDENTKATLDMIITVVGELYGQRDLLQYRDDMEWF